MISTTPSMSARSHWLVLFTHPVAVTSDAAGLRVVAYGANVPAATLTGGSR